MCLVGFNLFVFCSFFNKTSACLDKELNRADSFPLFPFCSFCPPKKQLKINNFALTPSINILLDFTKKDPISDPFLGILRKFQNTLGNLVRRSFLPAFQTVDCYLATPVKRGLLKISTFWDIPMHVFAISKELQNGKISLVTLLRNDSITRSPGNFKNSWNIAGNICGGVNFQYSYE